jgi:hypothetical protein
MIGTPVGLADLVHALKRLHPRDHGARSSIASLLGFTVEDLLDAPVEEIPPPSAVTSPEIQPLLEPPTPPDQGARHDRAFRVRRRARGAASSDVGRAQLVVPQGAVLPAAARGEGAPPPLAPLLTPQWSRALLATLARSWVASGEVHLHRLVTAIADRQPLQRVPRIATPTVRRGLQILVDVGEGMTPFARDQSSLVAAARRVVGDESVSVLRFIGSPLSRCWREKRPKAIDYRPPAAGTPILLLTALNIGSGPAAQDISSDDEWLAFAALVRHAGCPVTALVPYGSDRWPDSLRRALPIVAWDRTSDVRSVQRIAPARRRV